MARGYFSIFNDNIDDTRESDSILRYKFHAYLTRPSYLKRASGQKGHMANSTPPISQLYGSSFLDLTIYNGQRSYSLCINLRQCCQDYCASVSLLIKWRQ
jgi:hypothetical protein